MHLTTLRLRIPAWSPERLKCRGGAAVKRYSKESLIVGSAGGPDSLNSKSPYISLFLYLIYRTFLKKPIKT